MEKLYNEEGKVAVAVSPGFGAGWSTWGNVNPMDKRYNELFLKGDLDAVFELAEEQDQYDGGAEDVIIAWLEPGTEFIITDYDGAESIEFKEATDWYIA